MPSQAELFYKYYKDKKVKVRSENFQKAIDMYGGEEHLNQPEATLTGENEAYCEYNPNGKIKKSVVKNINKSIYPEDLHINGHKHVWGSFYNDNFGWGYKCCYSFEKNSYCKGTDGKKENTKRIVSL